jgi:hypothetical protein
VASASAGPCESSVIPTPLAFAARAMAQCARSKPDAAP